MSALGLQESLREGAPSPSPPACQARPQGGRWTPSGIARGPLRPGTRGLAARSPKRLLSASWLHRVDSLRPLPPQDLHGRSNSQTHPGYSGGREEPARRAIGLRPWLFAGCPLETALSS